MGICSEKLTQESRPLTSLNGHIAVIPDLRWKLWGAATPPWGVEAFRAARYSSSMFGGNCIVDDFSLLVYIFELNKLATWIGMTYEEHPGFLGMGDPLNRYQPMIQKACGLFQEGWK